MSEKEIETVRMKGIRQMHSGLDEAEYFLRQTLRAKEVPL
jgi:hypothetical protein